MGYGITASGKSSFSSSAFVGIHLPLLEVLFTVLSVAVLSLACQILVPNGSTTTL